MSNVAYINHDELTALIKSDAVAGKDYQVVDVRGECKKIIDDPQLANRSLSFLTDEDFRGGNMSV